MSTAGAAVLRAASTMRALVEVLVPVPVVAVPFVADPFVADPFLPVPFPAVFVPVRRAPPPPDVWFRVLFIPRVLVGIKMGSKERFVVIWGLGKLDNVDVLSEGGRLAEKPDSNSSKLLCFYVLLHNTAEPNLQSCFSLGGFHIYLLVS